MKSHTILKMLELNTQDNLQKMLELNTQDNLKANFELLQKIQANQEAEIKERESAKALAINLGKMQRELPRSKLKLPHIDKDAMLDELTAFQQREASRKKDLQELTSLQENMKRKFTLGEARLFKKRKIETQSSYPQLNDKMASLKLSS